MAQAEAVHVLRYDCYRTGQRSATLRDERALVDALVLLLCQVGGRVEAECARHAMRKQQHALYVRVLGFLDEQRWLPFLRRHGDAVVLRRSQQRGTLLLELPHTPAGRRLQHQDVHHGVR